MTCRNSIMKDTRFVRMNQVLFERACIWRMGTKEALFSPKRVNLRVMTERDSGREKESKTYQVRQGEKNINDTGKHQEFLQTFLDKRKENEKNTEKESLVKSDGHVSKMF